MSLDLQQLFLGASEVVAAFKTPDASAPPLSDVQGAAVSSVPYQKPGSNVTTAQLAAADGFQNQNQTPTIRSNNIMLYVAGFAILAVGVYAIRRR